MSVDLSKLPAPDVVEALDFESILADMRTDLIARATAVSADFGAQITNALALESEPSNLLLEVCAYRELMLRARVNDAARQCMLAFASGTNLVNLAANLGVVAFDGEEEEHLRARAAAAPDSWSTAGPEAAYEELARNASAMVSDVKASSPSPGQVTVAVLSSADDGVADADLLAAVADALSPTSVRPFTDQVSVVSAGVASYDVMATLYIASGLDTATVQAAALAAVQAYGAARRKLGKGVAVAGIDAALMVAGVENLVRTAPLADISAAASSAPVLGTVTLATMVGGDGV